MEGTDRDGGRQSFVSPDEEELHHDSPLGPGDPPDRRSVSLAKRQLATEPNDPPLIRFLSASGTKKPASFRREISMVRYTALGRRWRPMHRPRSPQQELIIPAA